MAKKKVLIVDDEAIVRMDIREMLESYDYDVIGEAADGIDAVELCRKEKPDLLLIDVKMPIMDGLSASKLIHEENNNIAIVVLTAYNDEHFVDKAVDNGCIGYLVKPVAESTLLPALKIALKRTEELAALQTELKGQKKKFEDKKITDRAKAILMQEREITEEEAYRYLRTVSMKKRLSIRSVAEMIIHTNEMLHGH